MRSRGGSGVRRTFGVLAAVVIVGSSLVRPDVAAAGTRSFELSVPSTPLTRFSYPYLVNDAGQVAGSGSEIVPPVRGLFWAPPAVPVVLGEPPAPPGSGSLAPMAINDTGAIALFGSGCMCAYRWDPSGSFTDVGTLGGQTMPAGIDRRGRVVGYSSPTGWTRQNPSDDRAVIWDDANGLQQLGALGTSSRAAAIDDAGDVVGFFYDTSHDIHLFRWTESTGMVDLGVLRQFNEFPEDTIHRIAADGTIYGSYENWPGHQAHVFRWSAANGIEQWPLPMGMIVSGVSDDGVWAGRTWPASGSPSTAFVWTPQDGSRDIGPPGETAYAVGTNAAGDVVVATRANSWSDALAPTDSGYLWNAAHGLIKLNTDGRAMSPTAISDTGYITGKVAVDGEIDQPFVLRVHLEPEAPEALAAATNTAGVVLSWTAPTTRAGDGDVRSYRVYRDDVFNGSVDASTRAWTDYGPDAGDHRYTVTALNAYGESVASDAAVVDVAAPAATVTPIAAIPAFTG